MINHNVTAKTAFGEVQKREADLAKLAQKTGDSYTDQKDVVAKDTLQVAPGLEKKTSEELAKLYETYNTDSQDGLNENEFEALFNAVVQPEPATPTPAAATTAAAEPQVVTVKAGDTLSKIARQHDVTLAELKEANPELFKEGKDAAGKTRSSGGNLIYPGDQVKIPAKAQATPSAPTTPTPSTTAPSTTAPSTTTPAGGTTSADPVAALKARTSGPDADVGKTWADHANTTKKEFNFGHQTVDGSLWKKSDAGDVVWSDNGKKVSWNQINAMPEPQRQAYFKQAGIDPAPAREAIANNPAQGKPEGDMAVKMAKETIDNARLYEIAPEAAVLLTPEDLASFKAVDQKTLDLAKKALEQIPASDAQRASYETKVQQLQTAFDTQYGVSAGGETPGATPGAIDVDMNMDDNEARRMVSSRTPAELDGLNVGLRLGMIHAMARGATSVAEDQAIGKVAQSIARTNPEALTSDVIRQMDDNGVREFIKGSTEADLDKLPAQARTAMIRELAEGATSVEEDGMIGQLAASLARTAPEGLTAEVVQQLDDNGVRALMGLLSADDLNRIPPAGRQAMMQELVAGYTSSEEDVMIGRIGSSLAATHPEAITPELVRGMDDNGVRLMTKDMSVAELSKLPKATLEAMREELRAGWTTEEEYRQLDKLAQALRPTP